jgi:ATP-dependent Clp protease ATP-binding subunit ClpA
MGAANAKEVYMQAEFGGFSLEVRQALARAQAEATRRGRRTVGTDLFLLGLINGRDDVTSEVLQEVGVDSDTARDRLQALAVDFDEPDPFWIGVTIQLRRVLELSAAQARGHDAQSVDTLHVLLGLLDLDEERPDRSLLEYIGAERAALRTAIEQHLGASQD